jgi:hypothetical protein
MRDPERLLQRPPSDFTAKLLRAGAEEKPSSAALRRTLKVAAVGTAIGASLQASSASAAVLGAKSSLVGMGGGAVASGVAGGAAAGAGVAVGAATSAAAGSGVAALTAVAIAKWVGVGAIGGAMAATAAHRFAPGSLSAVSVTRATSSAWVAAAPPRPQQPASRRAPGATGVSARFAESAPLTEPAREQPASPATAAFAAEVASAPEVTSPAAAARPAQAVPAVPAMPQGQAEGQAQARAASQSAALPATPVLAAEVAMVDRGRAALQRGDGAGALHALAGYEAAFPKQQLSPEVLFLRMEALVRIGNLSQARALAQRIVARGATGPQAVRARELLGR